MSLLVLVALTASLLPFVGFASEEAEACPAGPEICGWAHDAVFGTCDPISSACDDVEGVIEQLIELGPCSPVVCTVIERVLAVDPWATVATTADNLARQAIDRACAIGVGGPEEGNGGLTLHGEGIMICEGQNGPPLRMSLTVCIQMNPAPGQAGWVDHTCNSGESLPFERELTVEVTGLCVPGPGDGHRWRVRGTGEAWFNNVAQPADFTLTADSYGRRLDCQPG